MNLFKDFIDISLKKNICLINMTDEFFCVFLKSVKEKYNSGILVVVDSIYDEEAYDAFSVEGVQTRLNDILSKALMNPISKHILIFYQHKLKLYRLNKFL